MQPKVFARRFAEWLPVVVAVGGGVLIAVVAITIALRVGYAFELEWLEGGVDEHVRRVLQGEPLYTEPTVDWTPFLYTPFYYYVCAALALVFGPSLVLERLVSAVSFGVSLWFVGSLTRRYTDSKAGAWIAAGLFAGTYHLTEAWYDLAKMDSLAVMLLLIGVRLADPERGLGQAALSGVVLFLAFFTKQPMLAVAVPCLVALTIAAPKKGLLAASVFAITVLGTTMVWDAVTDDWYSFYVWEMGREHRSDWHLSHTLWWANTSRFTAVVLVALVGCARVQRTREGFAKWVERAGTLAASMFAGLVGVVHDGGGINAFMPMFAIAPIMAVRTVYDEATERPWLHRIGLVVVAVQLGWLARDPRRFIPDQRHDDAGRVIVAHLSEGSGSLWAPGHLALVRKAGRDGPRAHMMALCDVFKTDRRRIKKRLRREIVRGMKKNRFDEILIGNDVRFFPPRIRKALGNRYGVAATVFQRGQERRFLPLSGFTAHPRRLLVPGKGSDDPPVWISAQK